MADVAKKSNMTKTILLLLLGLLVLVLLTFFCALPKVYKNINIKTGELVALDVYAGTEYTTDKTKVFLQGNLAQTDSDSLIAKVRDIFAVSQVEYTTKTAQVAAEFNKVKFVLDKKADVVALGGLVASDELVDMATGKLANFKLSSKLATDKKLPTWWAEEAVGYIISLPQKFSKLAIDIDENLEQPTLILTGELAQAKDEVKQAIEDELNTRFGEYLTLDVQISMPGQEFYAEEECQSKLDEHLAKNPVHFARAKSYLNQASKTSLETVAQIMKKCEPGLRFEIAGHADSRGSDAINIPLSDDRAKNTLQYIQNAGIVADRLVAKGYSSGKPVASNNSDVGRALNRRADITIKH